MNDLTEDEQVTAFTKALEEVLEALLGPPVMPVAPAKRRSNTPNKRRTVSKKPTQHKSASKAGHTQKKRAAR